MHPHPDAASASAALGTEVLCSTSSAPAVQSVRGSAGPLESSSKGSCISPPQQACGHTCVTAVWHSSSSARHAVLRPSNTCTANLININTAAQLLSGSGMAGESLPDANTPLCLPMKGSHHQRSRTLKPYTVTAPSIHKLSQANL